MPSLAIDKASSARATTGSKPRPIRTAASSLQTTGLLQPAALVRPECFMMSHPPLLGLKDRDEAHDKHLTRLAGLARIVQGDPGTTRSDDLRAKPVRAFASF